MTHRWGPSPNDCDTPYATSLKDATGSEVPDKYVYACDIDTGEVERGVLETKGTVKIDWERGHVLTEVVRYPAPLTIFFGHNGAAMTGASPAKEETWRDRPPML